MPHCHHYLTHPPTTFHPPNHHLHQARPLHPLPFQISWACHTFAAAGSRHNLRHTLVAGSLAVDNRHILPAGDRRQKAARRVLHRDCLTPPTPYPVTSLRTRRRSSSSVAAPARTPAAGTAAGHNPPADHTHTRRSAAVAGCLGNNLAQNHLHRGSAACPPRLAAVRRARRPTRRLSQRARCTGCCSWSRRVGYRRLCSQAEGLPVRLLAALGRRARWASPIAISGCGCSRRTCVFLL
ncbi:hypothetical protein B0O99DRAFT_627542, partial [Bisporella sp. PMI_857]